MCAKTAVSKPVTKAGKPTPKAKKDDDEPYTTTASKVGKEKDPNAPKRP